LVAMELLARDASVNQILIFCQVGFVARIQMIEKQAMDKAFDHVTELSGNVYFAQNKTKTHTYNYWLKPAARKDLLVVAEDIIDDSFALDIIQSAPDRLSSTAPTVYTLPKPSRHFTHIIAVPSSYHRCLGGHDPINRDDVYLCVPFFRCEFSGDESELEFKAMMQRTVLIFKWQREPAPKLIVYFDNPVIGTGTLEDGVLMKLSTLLLEIKNLNGVTQGFIEVTNYKGEVIEVLSPEKDNYVLIRNRKDETPMPLLELINTITSFAGV
ncbi:hypothetical protein, partial [Pseudomonas syringae]